MTKYFITFFSLFLFTTSHAGIRIYSGGNASILNIENQIPFGEIFGVEKVWFDGENSWSLAVQYVVRRAYITDNTMLFHFTEQGYHFNALLSVGYLEFPLMTIIDSPITENLSWGVTLGPSLAIAIYDDSKWDNSRHFNSFDNPDEWHNIRDYYYEAEDPGSMPLQSNSGIYLNGGVFIDYRNFFLELRYSHSINKLGYLAGLQMEGEKYRTLELFLGIRVR